MQAINLYVFPFVIMSKFQMMTLGVYISNDLLASRTLISLFYIIQILYDFFMQVSWNNIIANCILRIKPPKSQIKPLY